MRRSGRRRLRCGGGEPADRRLAQLPEDAVERGRVELAVAVLAERRKLIDLTVGADGARLALRTRREAPDRAGAVVAEHIATSHRRHRGAAVDVAAGDRAALTVRIDELRQDEIALAHERLVRVVGRLALEPAPAVVRKRGDPRRRTEVDFLPRALADVPDPEVAVRPVERKAPRVAKAEADDLPRGSPARRIDAQQLAEAALQILRAVPRVAAGAAVPHADVQIPARVERELAAVVVLVRLVDEEQLPRGRGPADAARRAELDHARVAVPVG